MSGPEMYGEHIEHRFRWAPDKPPRPTGNEPSGWGDSPHGTLRMTGDYLWISSVKKTKFNRILGEWTEPEVVTLTHGQTFTTLIGHPGFDRPHDMLDEDWREYLRQTQATVTAKFNKLFDDPLSGLSGKPLESSRNIFLDE